MGFDLDLYRRGSRALDLSGIDFASFRDQPLPAAALRCVRYMHDVEFHTACYLRNLLNTRAHHDPEITAFLTMWNYEEMWHGEALAQVLENHDESAGGARVAAMRERMGWRITTSPIGWMAFSALTPRFLAVHMTVGAVNEWTAQAGYARLAAVAGHPTLTELLKRIMRQEGRHVDAYAGWATEELDGSHLAQRTTRAVLRTAWKPVGARAMPRAESEHMARTLFAGTQGSRAVDRVDGRVARLPGMAGLRPLQRSLAGIVGDHAAAA